MTDKELLELAAKAIGPELWFFDSLSYLDGASQDRMLDPLEINGDAFFLAVELGIDINFYPSSDEVAAVKHKAEMGYKRCFEKLKDDPYAATRRAIVRAAAEIGKQKE
jgi:hypothetical protein